MSDAVDKASHKIFQQFVVSAPHGVSSLVQSTVSDNVGPPRFRASNCLETRGGHKLPGIVESGITRGHCDCFGQYFGTQYLLCTALHDLQPFSCYQANELFPSNENMINGLARNDSS